MPRDGGLAARARRGRLGRRPRFLRRTLLAYGYAESTLDGGALPCRLMAHALLHRYSNLRWYLERLPVPGATTLEQLAAHGWALREMESR